MLGVGNDDDNGLECPMSSSSLNTRIAETVATDLRERILGGRLADNLLPKQEELIAEFGVSAPSIREALRILEIGRAHV